MRVALLVVGVILTGWILLGIIKVMLIPRGTRSWVVTGVNWIVHVITRIPLRMIGTYGSRDRWLTGAAPAQVLLSLVVYVVLLITTLGFVIYGTTSLNLLDSLYQSGATLTTLGIVEPVNVPSTITTFVAAFLGLVIIAIFIGYLLGIYGAFTSREGPMARLALIAGEPAWGPQILARGFALKMPPDDAPNALEWIEWVTNTRMNTQTNSVLAELRSPSPNRHWTVSLLAVLDAVALRMSLDRTANANDVRLIGAGTVAAAVLAGDEHVHNWDVEAAVLQVLEAPEPASLTRPDGHLSQQELNEGWTALRQVGYPLPDDLRGVENTFLSIRSLYAQHVLALAEELHAVPAPWSGPRTPAMPTIWPEMVSRSGGAS